MDTAEKRNHALEFLEGLERRHDRLLDELDDLNARIESAIESYQRLREQNDARPAEAPTEQSGQCS